MSEFQIIQLSQTELANQINEAVKTGFESIIKDIVPIKNDVKEFLTRKETADLLSVSLVCLHDWVNKGIIHHYKLGNRTYFKYSDLVETLLSSNKRA